MDKAAANGSIGDDGMGVPASFLGMAASYEAAGVSNWGTAETSCVPAN